MVGDSELVVQPFDHMPVTVGLLILTPSINKVPVTAVQIVAHAMHNLPCLHLIPSHVGYNLIVTDTPSQMPKVPLIIT